MSIQSILERKGAKVFTIEPTATVRTAAQLMQMHGIAALVVKSADVIGGLVSEREIVHAISQHGERALSMAVLNVMTRSAITVTPDDTFETSHDANDQSSGAPFDCDWERPTRRHR